MDIANTFAFVWLLCLFGSSQGLKVSLTIREESEPGSKVGNLFTQLPDRDMITYGDSIFSPMLTDSSAYFSVDRLTGDIKVAKRIDLENLDCKDNPREPCLLKFSINVLSKSSIVDILDMEITILDINDNGCEFFPRPRQTIKFREDARPRESLEDVFRPKDPDPNYSIDGSQIRLEQPSNVFELKKIPSKAVAMPYDLKLVLLQRLDFETKQSYNLRVVAGDGERNHKCSLDLTVEIEDVNDHIPKFTLDIYSKDVFENTSIGNTLIKVFAQDSDSGVHGKVIYEIDQFSSGSVLKTFSINSSTGEVYLKSKLSYANRKSYTISLIARNSGSGSRVGKSELKITVIDVNDNLPKIEVFARRGSSMVVLEEEVTRSVDVASVSVTDADAGDNGEVACEMTQTPGKENAFILTLVGSSGKYKVSKVAGVKFDREQTENVSFTIRCHDMGQPRLTSEKDVLVQITDINDHPPIFKKKEYKISVPEDNDPQRSANGYALITVKAQDADVGDNGRVQYYLQAPSSTITGMVRVDKETGEVFSTGSLDRETLPKFSFAVVASDRGDPPLSSLVTIHVTVEDINDHAPRFFRKEYNFNVEENRPVGTLVGVLRAQDLDGSSINSKLNFKLIESGTLSSDDLYAPASKKNMFRIVPRLDTATNSYEVQLYTTQPIDREAVIHSQHSSVYPIYVVQVMAEDMGQRRLRHQVPVQIHVQDVNDETPRFTFPSGNNSHVAVSFMEEVGYQFAKLTAVDRDAGENGTIYYGILSGNVGGYFSVNSNTGALTIARKLPDTLTGRHVIDVEASDRGRTPRSNRARLRIQVDSSAPQGHRGGLFGSDLGGSATNLYIIIAIVVASFVIALVLLTAICVVLRRSRRIPHRDTEYKNSGDFSLYPSASGTLRVPYQTATLPHEAAFMTQQRREITFRRAPSLDHVPLGPLKPPPYHPVPQCEDKRNSLASADRDSGNGDSVDVNPARYGAPCVGMGGPSGHLGNCSGAGPTDHLLGGYASDSLYTTGCPTPVISSTFGHVGHGNNFHMRTFAPPPGMGGCGTLSNRLPPSTHLSPVVVTSSAGTSSVLGPRGVHGGGHPPANSTQIDLSSDIPGAKKYTPLDFTSSANCCPRSAVVTTIASNNNFGSASTASLNGGDAKKPLEASFV